MIQPYERIEIKMLLRKIKIKWWKKFNNNLVCKNMIQEWLKHNSWSKDSLPLKKDALFLETTINDSLNINDLKRRVWKSFSKSYFFKRFRQNHYWWWVITVQSLSLQWRHVLLKSPLTVICQDIVYHKDKVKRIK